MNADVEAAIKRLEQYLHITISGKHFRSTDYDTIRQALRDQESEIASNDAEVAELLRALDMCRVRSEEAEAETGKLREKAYKFMWQVRDTCTRAEKAEALLSETWGFMRNEGIDWHDSKTGSLCERITAHLGATHER